MRLILKSSSELEKTLLYVNRQGIRQINPGTFVHAIAYADYDNDGDEDVDIIVDYASRSLIGWNDGTEKFNTN
jgi:hypothetical protein